MINFFRSFFQSKIGLSLTIGFLGLIAIAFEDVPRIPLWQPSLNSAMRPSLDGYEYWFHRQLDARKFSVS